jgi:glutaredoxin
MIIIFTLHGCPACKELKTNLDKNGYEYIDIDIEEYSLVWEEVVKTTNLDIVPTILLKETSDDGVYDEEKKSILYIASVDFNNIDEAIGLIENYFTNKGA